MRESLRAMCSTNSGVASVLQLSTTVYDQFEYVCRRTLATHSSMYAAPLYTGVSTLTSGKSLLKAAVSPRAHDNRPTDLCEATDTIVIRANGVRTHSLVLELAPRGSGLAYGRKPCDGAFRSAAAWLPLCCWSVAAFRHFIPEPGYRENGSTMRFARPFSAFHFRFKRPVRDHDHRSSRRAGSRSVRGSRRRPPSVRRALRCRCETSMRSRKPVSSGEFSVL